MDCVSINKELKESELQLFANNYRLRKEEEDDSDVQPLPYLDLPIEKQLVSVIRTAGPEGITIKVQKSQAANITY